MSYQRPKRNYFVKLTNGTGQVAIPKQPSEEEIEQFYIHEATDLEGNTVLAYHTYDYSEVDKVDEVDYTRKYNGRQTTVPAALREDDWEGFIVEIFENAHGTVYAFYPVSEDESNQGE